MLNSPIKNSLDSMKHYSTYQSQFIEMFGCKTPNVKVGDVSSVVSGKSISKDLEDIPGDIAYVKVADFNLPENNKYIQVSSRYVTSENANSSKLIPPGTIIFAKNGAASMSNKKRLTAIECCIDMNTLAIIPNSQKVDSEFLYAIFDSLDLRFFVRQGAVPSISPHTIEGIEIYLPSFDEQLSFSKICKQADKSKFAALKSQFIEMFGNGNWEQKALGQVGTFKRGGGFQKSDYVERGIPCIHYGQIHTKFGPFIYSHITEISSDLESKTKFAAKGDLIIAITSEDTEGSCKSTAWLGDYPVAVGGHAAIFHHCMNPVYMSFFFKSALFNYAKMEYVHGTKVCEIKPDDIAKILVPCPPMSLQEDFSAIAQQADKSKYIN